MESIRKLSSAVYKNKIILFSVDKNLEPEYFKLYRILFYTFQGL